MPSKRKHVQRNRNGSNIVDTPVVLQEGKPSDSLDPGVSVSQMTPALLDYSSVSPFVTGSSC